MLPATTLVSAEELGAPEAAVAVIIDPNHLNGSLLLIRRTVREGDPWSGQIAFPGGRKQPKDRDLKETAVRETAEEVGINLRGHTCLGMLPPAYARTNQILVAPFVFHLESRVNARLNAEVAECFWIPVRDLAKIKMSRREVRTQREKLMVDSYFFEGHVIWGLTFRIINTLLDSETIG